MFTCLVTSCHNTINNNTLHCQVVVTVDLSEMEEVSQLEKWTMDMLVFLENLGLVSDQMRIGGVNM